MAHLGAVSIQATLHLSRTRTFELRAEGDDGKLTRATILLNGREIGRIDGITTTTGGDVTSEEEVTLYYAFTDMVELVKRLDNKL